MTNDASRHSTASGEIASYVGVSPRLRQSEKKRFLGSPTIAFGNARLWKALWMVMSSTRCVQSVAAAVLRTASGRGEPGKVAVIAAMRKLLAAGWSVARHRRAFVPRLSSEPPQDSST